ncbi:MAG: hypothetical protein NT106_08305 [Candidatus Sumerlaeota bacterium]|nr:hypothetical protein [Candidatus Sumerlaeota bacterium]
MKSTSQNRVKYLLFLFITLVAINAPGSTTKVFRHKSFGDFSSGELKSTSLTSDGKLFPAPAFQKIGTTEEGLVWRIISRPDGAFYFSTGNEGKIFILEKNKKAELYCDLEEVAAFALALDAKGILYAGASPGGKIYRIAQKEKTELFFDTKQEYVWDLLFDAEGNLFAATGTEGKLFKIKPDSTGEIYFECPDKNIMDIMTLSRIKDSSIFMATQDKGRIYKVYEKGRAFVLYDSGSDEVRALAEGEEGFLYAAINMAKTITPQPTAPEQRKESDSPDEMSETPEKPQKGEPTRLMLPLVVGKKSGIIKLDISGYVWPVLDAPESPIHCLLYDAASKCPIAGIGEKGKLYQAEEFNKYTAIMATDEKYILSLLQTDKGLFYGTGEAAAVYSLNWKDLSRGEYISSAQDAGTAVKWGMLRIEGRFPHGTSVKFSTRGGNTTEPDKSWSDWTKEEPLNTQAMIMSPVARVLQYKLLLSGRDENTYPVVQQVEAYYIPPNRAPIFEQIEISREGKPAPAPAPRPVPKEKMEGKPESKQSPSSSDSSATIDAKANSNPQKVKINWKVNDPEGDQMRYTLYYKGEDEALWKKIEDKLDKNTYDFSTAPLPDGHYRIKVVATDLPSNPKTAAMESEYVSEIFIVDNTPPQFVEELTYDRREKNSIVVHAAVEDKLSIISSAQYSVNAGDWFNLLPVDEIFDSERETFSFSLTDLKQEEVTITLMVTDEEGNTVVGKLLVDLKKKK